MHNADHPNALSGQAMPPQDWNAAFAALPLETPPGDGWVRVTRALDARAGASDASVRIRRSHRRWFALAAVLAVVALAPVALMRQHREATTAPTFAAAQPTVPAEQQSTVQVRTDRPPVADAIATSPPKVADVPSATRVAASTARTASNDRHAPPRRAAGTPKARPRQEHPTDAIAQVAAADNDTRSSAPQEGTTSSEALRQLQAESARLEALVAMTRDDRVGSAAATVMTTDLDQRIGLIDAGLTQGTLPPAQREALWRERVQTLRELAGVETTQLWLATQGERYDGALVSVD